MENLEHLNKSDDNLCSCDHFHFTCIVLIRVLNMYLFLHSTVSTFYRILFDICNIFLIDLTNVIGPPREVNSEFETGDKDIEEWERIPKATGKLSSLFITFLTLQSPTCTGHSVFYWLHRILPSYYI